MNIFKPQLFSDQLDAQLFPVEVGEEEEPYIPPTLSQTHAEYVPEEVGLHYTPQYVTDHQHEAYTPEFVTSRYSPQYIHQEKHVKFLYPQHTQQQHQQQQQQQQQQQREAYQVHKAKTNTTVSTQGHKTTTTTCSEAPPNMFRNRFQVLEKLEEDGQLFECESEEEEAASLKRVRETEGGGTCRWPGWPGDNVFRLVVPVKMVGPIIGKKGEFVKRICQETKSRIKILDGVPGASERVVMVFARGLPEVFQPPAMEAVIRVHSRIIDANRESGDLGWAMTSRLLIPPGQVGSIIGKQGVTVKSIHDASGANIHILSPEEVPAYALHEDRMVEIQGSSEKVHHALELVVDHLRKFLVDRSVIPLFEHCKFKPSRPNNTFALQTSPPAESEQALTASIPESDPHGSSLALASGFPAKPASPVGCSLQTTTVTATPASPSPLAATQVKQLIQIPLSYAEAIIGTSGANISYMRRNSGANISIQETTNVPGEMTVEIQGTAQQVRYAHQLIEEFVQRAQSQCSYPPQQQQLMNAAGQAHYPTPAYGF